MWSINQEELTRVADRLTQIAAGRSAGRAVINAQENLTLTIPKGFVASETKRVLEKYLPYAYQNGPYQGYGNESSVFLGCPYFKHIVNALTPEEGYSRNDRLARRDQVWVLLDSLRQSAQIEGEADALKWWNPQSYEGGAENNATPPASPDRNENETPSPSGGGEIPTWVKVAGAAGLAWFLLA